MFIKFYTFHCIFMLSTNKKQLFHNKLSHLIPIHWQIILFNEGSLTEILNYLNGKKTIFQMYQKNNYTLRNNRYLRCIWIESCLYTKMIFAQSLWQFKYTNNSKQKNKLEYNIPVGKLIINTEVDIYKQIHEIYYGYSIELENKLNYHKAIWGRKYTLYYNHKLFITIQEFFSPNITNFFIH
uniref:Ycf21 n=1 Tax=Caloglossa beccarii TaxID=131038 RepID=A0A1Z1M8C1_9FLOR|nr:hypothetical protein [Caloglossa beccarii]ARW62230.1 hypothetical protein [Caloglossa beccarii]